jgi:hypothetical protein
MQYSLRNGFNPGRVYHRSLSILRFSTILALYP